MLWACVAAAGPFDGGSFFDDAETGTALTTDLPAGNWSSKGEPGGNTVGASAAAAHRGAFGQRLTDTTGGNAAGVQGELRASLATGQQWPTFFTRAWVRVNGNLNGGNLVLMAVDGNHRSVSVYIEPNGTLTLAGYDTNNVFNNEKTDAGCADGGWHLVELAGRGYGSDGGEQLLWLDGDLVTSKSGRDWPDVTIGSFAVGEIFTNQRAFVGSIDFDDVATSLSPLASALEVAAVPVTDAGACIAVSVRLVNSVDGGLSPSPRSMLVGLTADKLVGTFWPSPDCSGAPTSALFFDAGLSSLGASFRADQGGSGTLYASEVDFISRPTPLAVATGPGSVDAGSPDAGSDADAGTAVSVATDAGDANGLRPTRALDIGCGCRSASSVVGWVAVLTIAAFRRHRSRQR